MIINSADAADYDEDLLQYGTKRHSGRYPYGSGGENNAGTNSPNDFLDLVASYSKQGLTQAQIAVAMGITTTQLRGAKTIAKNEKKQADISRAVKLKDTGMSNSAIGREMGINESVVRGLLQTSTKEKADILGTTKSMIKDRVEGAKYVDVGTGSEYYLNVSSTQRAVAVQALVDEGYKIHYVKVPQGASGNDTTLKVLTKPDVPYSEVYANRNAIQQLRGGPYTEDGGRSSLGILPPLAISPRRVQVVYDEDGGSAKDGLLEIRPGKKDVSLGGSNYAQVRVQVGDSHFLKGMAVYNDDLPAGVDIRFNTNKSKAVGKLGAMKELKRVKETGEVDLDNPFGSLVRQITVKDKNGDSKVTSAMNLVNEEENWEKWSKNLSSQMLSKQSPVLARDQLGMTYERRRNELDTILRLTNPAVRRKLLDSFADDTDAAAVHLKAAGLPRQTTNVLLPITSLKPTEVYAPTMRHGERLALIRYPHGGKFEIPEVVNNLRNKEARKTIGTDATAAIGIHPDVAKRLSGADFDGDTVLVIPNASGRIKSEPGLRDLADFDPQRRYPAYEGMPKLTDDRKQQLMGDVSNLITDMTIKGATNAELARAVRHSMVVIDAEKHNLNYKLSAEDNGILALKRKYQPTESGRPGGASTIVSQKKSPLRINERRLARSKEGGPIDRETGKKRFVDTGATYQDRITGETRPVTKKIKKLEYFDDAHVLSSGTPIEKIYADHSNRLKDLANEARKASVNTKSRPYDREARLAYADEVKNLNAKLALAEMNRPLERQARIIAAGNVAAKKKQYPDMSSTDMKKIQAQAIAEARTRTGARKAVIPITDKEWDAIQAGAITDNKLNDILRNADLTEVKKLATPRTQILMTSSKAAVAESMLSRGYTQSEVADVLGVSLSTLKASLGGGS